MRNPQALNFRDRITTFFLIPKLSSTDKTSSTKHFQKMMQTIKTLINFRLVLHRMSEKGNFIALKLKLCYMRREFLFSWEKNFVTTDVGGI